MESIEFGMCVSYRPPRQVYAALGLSLTGVVNVSDSGHANHPIEVAAKEGCKLLVRPVSPVAAAAARVHQDVIGKVPDQAMGDRPL